MSQDEIDLDLKSIQHIYMCRVCLTRKNIQPIHKYTLMVNGTLKTEDLTMKLAYCTDIRVLKNDKKPTFICEKCVTALNTAYSFKMLSAKTDSKLNAIIKRDVIKSCVTNTAIINENNFEEIASAYRKQILEKGRKIRPSIRNGSYKSIETDRSNIKNNSNSSNSLEGIPNNCLKTTYNVPITYENPTKKSQVTTDNDHNYSAKNTEILNIDPYTEDITDSVVIKTENIEFADPLNLNPLENVTFDCKGCEKSFVTKELSLEHEKTCDLLRNSHEEGLEIFLPCPVCKKIYRSSYLKNHIKLHSDDKKFVCKICGRTFTRKTYHDTHIQTHNIEKNLACSLCDYRTKQPSSLLVHMRRHTGEKPFTCDICGQKSIAASNALNHRRRHDLNKYKCNKCGETFGLQKDLESHVSLVHEE